MSTTSQGLQQLLEAKEFKVKIKVSLLKNVFTVSTTQGPLFKVKGVVNYKMRDNDDTVVIEAHRPMRFFGTPTMEVILCGTPPLIVKHKSLMSRSLNICEENDRVLLTIKRPLQFSFHPEFEIWSTDEQGEKIVQIGTVQQTWTTYNVSFPKDLEVRCKAALIGAIILINEEQNRHH